ncbi:SpoIIE family protein phosphatase [Candidatus Parabeggiatoa sp. HSG14]|uniref:PP2C family protein-serine/threonine phosphatase n=1 Tax=Candidatus Parabeggiatoa sp. HSG14 TaxID=3055593 RepID=UPI0025A72029|nr:SpoIIE family protein phosphatase [Thiotrichales bacterium HSG14]
MLILLQFKIITTTYCRTTANNETNPVKFLTALNETVYNNVQRMNSDKNLTFALLEYQKGNLSLTGQHEEILFVRKGGSVERIDTLDLGFPIGWVDDISDCVVQKKIHLDSGDGIVLYTDGVTEALNSDKVEYSLERLCEVISHYWHLSAKEIQQAVIADMRQYIRLQKVYDDITLLVLKQK